MTAEDQAAWQRGQELADLRWHWGQAYVITWQDGQFRADRRDTGAAVRSDTAAGLSQHIRADYGVKPVPRSIEASSPGSAL